MRALKIKSAADRAVKWPTICVLMVVFQWFAWNQVGLSTDTGFIANWPTPEKELTQEQRLADEFERGHAGNAQRADVSEFCQALSSWPLPGCQVG